MKAERAGRHVPLFLEARPKSVCQRRQTANRWEGNHRPRPVRL